MQRIGGHSPTAGRLAALLSRDGAAGAADPPRQREHFVERVLEATPELLFVHDLDLRRGVVVNEPSSSILGYTAAEFEALGPALLPALLGPDELARFQADMERIREIRDERVLDLEYRVRHRDGTRRWMAVRAVIFARDATGRARQILGLTRDVTARKQNDLALQRANAALRRRVADLTALNAIAQALTAGADPPETLESVAGTATSLFDAAGVGIWRLDDPAEGGGPGLDDATLTRLASAGREGAGSAGGPVLPLAGHPLVRRILAQGQPASLPPADAVAGGLLAVPLRARGAPVGLLLIRAATPGRVYARSDVELAQTVAGALAGALEAARLLDRERRLRREAERLRAAADAHARTLDARSRELAALLEVGRDLASTLELGPLLAALLEQLRRVLPDCSASIYGLEGDGGTLHRLGPAPPSREGCPPPTAEVWPLSLARHVGVVIRRRVPLLVPDVWAETWAARLFRASLARSEGGLPAPTVLGSWIGVPLVARDRVVGVLVVRHRERGHFTPHHVALAQAVANQAAVALENARLYREAQRAAAEKERRRLARELHDSVTQTLFAAKTTADVLPGLWERDPEVGREALAALGRLTQGAHTEMRSLLVELRPETLTRAPLHELLQTLVAAVTAKSRLAVEAALDPVPLLPADVQVALYRIAQEALNNVARHAVASHLSVRLEATPLAASVPAPLLPPSTLAVSLEVADDGQGFVPAAAPRGRLGLASMGERAAGVGAVLRLHSQPGAGTRVSVTWTGDVATPPGTSRSDTAQETPPAESTPLQNGAAAPLARLEEHAR